MTSRLSGTPGDWALRAFFVVLAIPLIVGAFTTDGFLTSDNVKAILTSTAFVGIIAIGGTVIMLGGSLFSLSMGTTVAVTSILFLYTLDYGIATAMIITLIAGALIFSIQGLIVGGIDASPIIVTIGAGALQVGLTTWLNPGNIGPPAGVDIDFLATTIFSLPVGIYAFFAVALAVGFIMKRTRYGREIYLLGENRIAARAAGLPVAWLTTGMFAIAGTCVAIAGILVAGFNQNSNLAVEGTFTFDAIAAILVGGNAVNGGYGSVGRTVIGALVIATISDLLLLRGASTGVQVLVKGLIVIVVVVLMHLVRREGRS